MKYLYHLSFICITLMAALPQAQAQQDANKWGIGLHLGMLTYYGDLSQNYIDPNSEMIDPLDNREFIAQGLTIQRHLSPAWSVRLSGVRGYFLANQRPIKWNGDTDIDNLNYRQALNVKTDILAGNLMLTYHFDNGKLLSKRSIVAPYISAGVGYVDFTPKADLFRNGDRYHYWSDGTIRNMQEGTPGANIISQDGDYETDLADLQTEGENYDTWALQIPVGLGVKFRLSRWLSLNVESVVHYTFTDYLDDVSGDYLTNYDNPLQAYAANPGNDLSSMRGNDRQPENDLYAFTSVSLQFHLGKRKRTPYIPPLITTRPNSDYDEFMREKIEPDTSRVLPTMPGEKSKDLIPMEGDTIVETSMKDSLEMEDVVDTYEVDTLIDTKVEEMTENLDSTSTINETSEELTEVVTTVDSTITTTIDSTITTTTNINTTVDSTITNVAQADTTAVETTTPKEDVVTATSQPDTVQIVENDERIKELQKELEALKAADAKESTTTTTTPPNTEVEALRQEIQEMRAEQRAFQLSLLENKIEEMNKENERLRTQMQQQQFEQKMQQQQFEQKTQMQIQQYEQQIEQLREEVRRLQSERMSPSTGDVKNSGTGYVERDERAIARLEAEVEALERKLYQTPAPTPTPSNSQPVVVENSSDNAALMNQLRRMEDRIDELSDNQKDSENRQLRAEVTELRNRIEAQEAQEKSNNALEQQLVETLAEIKADTTSGSQETGQALALLKTELSGLKSQLAEQRKENQALQQSISDLNQKVSNVSEDISATKNNPAPNPTPTPDPNKELLDKINELEKKLAEKPKEKVIVESKPAPRPYDPNAAAREAIRGLESSNIFFATNSTTVRPEHKNRLDQIARLALQYPNIDIRLTGYTDSTGNPDYNYKLSQRRAEAVKSYLVSRGVSPATISTFPSGQDNSSDKSFARRVNVVLLIR